jgi:hypothetical protein
MRAAAMNSATPGLLNFQGQLSSRIDAVHLTHDDIGPWQRCHFRGAVASFPKPPLSIAQRRA